MLNRALIFGLLLIAAQPGAGHAQAPAPSTNSAPTDHPMAVDGTSKEPNNVPEIIGHPTDPPDAVRSKATADPRAALEPPAVDSWMFDHRTGRAVGIEVDFRSPSIKPRPFAVLPRE
jgi:hypothetical protein